jgi:hypothetical protein
MKKSVRSFALVAALVCASVPAAHANRTGCDPHPRPATVSSTLSMAVYTVLSFLGI